ncbi:Transient receptor putative cation channel sub M member 2 [Sparganum proliferum]
MSTIRQRVSRVSSTVGDSTNSAHSPHGLQPSATIRRTSQVNRFHGEIEFTGLNQTAKFAKLSNSVLDSAIRDLLQRRWALKPPTLIITVYGTDFEKKRKLKMIFKKGLWKAADSGCWIVTGGFQLGIMKLAGEAVRDYTDAYGGNRMLAFGVASWGCVKKNDILEAALEEGTAIYQSEEDKDSDADQSVAEPTHAVAQKRTDVEEMALDPNHNYFVFADSNKNEKARGKEVEMRARFERCISLWSTSASTTETTGGPGTATAPPSAAPLSGAAQRFPHSSSVRKHEEIPGAREGADEQPDKWKVTSLRQASQKTAVGSGQALSRSSSKFKQSGERHAQEEVRIPMCGLVIGGDRFTLRQVYCSIMQNQCPMVIAKGTSGAADVIAFGLEAATKMETEELMEDKEAMSLETRLNSVMEQFLREMHPDYYNFSEEVSMLAEIITDYVSLVLVFDMEEDSDLDGYMISSLLASAGTATPPDQLNLEQLEITLTLNRADIAREKIFLENKRWKKGHLNDYMYQALMSDRHDFVKIFLEQGFSLEEFLTVYMLEKLYTDQLKSMSSKVAIFNKMWEYHRPHRQATKVTLRDVGKIIKSLVGDFYHPLYLSKEFQAKLAPEKIELANPKVKYKSGGQNPQIMPVRQSYRGELPENKTNTAIDAGPQTSTNILFTLPLEKAHGRVDGSPTREDLQRSIHRSSTHTTTLSTECSNYQVHELNRNAVDEPVSENAPSWSVVTPGRPTQVYRENPSREINYNGNSDRNDRDRARLARRQKRRLSFERMKELQLAEGHLYSNIATNTNNMTQKYPLLGPSGRTSESILFSQVEPYAYEAETFAPLARSAPSIDEPVHTKVALLRESSMESTYESQHTALGNGRGETGSSGSDSETGNLRTQLKKKLVEVLRKRSPETMDPTLGTGNLQTLKAVAALAAVAGGMGGGADHEKVTTNAEEARTKLIQLDRPARELLIWSILVGKLRMCELFWTMEKEPIAAALLASILLSALSGKTDDFTDKEDYRNYAKGFQEKAEGVLNECYREDEHRAQLIINHELSYYGHSSVIKLAAEGQSIKFMAHPCCQDFLTNTWKGNLSSKNSMFRFFLGFLFGLTMPLFIPKVILYEDSDKSALNVEDEGYPNAQESKPEDDSLEEMESRPVIKRSFATSLHLGALEYWMKIRDFYLSPIVRFVYHTISYALFLVLFSYLILVDFHVHLSVVEYIVLAWVITLFIEEIKQIAWAVLSGISFSTYISDGWNKLDCAGLILYIVGFTLRLMVLSKFGSEPNMSKQMEAYIILTDDITVPSRICMAFSLFVFYIRLMYTFSFHIALGPKLIMIGKMVTNDLIPFMIILTVIMVGYAVAAQSIAYPNGYYTSENLSMNGTVQGMQFIDTIFAMYTTAYFQMFGDFSLDALQGEDRNCQNGMCPTKTSRWLVPIMLGLYVLLTNILMFNLLIAMFSKTYEEIESASTYYWNYQRYQMIAEYVRRSPLVPPIIIFWHFYEAYQAIRNKCAIIRSNEQTKNNPFCVSFKDVKKEREMVKWEHMKAMDYLREPSTKSGGKRSGVESRAVVFRGVGAVAGIGPGPTMDLKTEMSAVTEGIGMELERRFKDLDSHFQRFNEVDSRLTEVTQTLSTLGEVVRQVTATQEQIIKKISELPTCQCIELVDDSSSPDKDEEGDKTKTGKKRTKLELAVQSALEAAKDVLRPPTPPPPPPAAPLPPRETEIPITAGAPGSEGESSGTEEPGDPKADPVEVPTSEEPNTGRTIQRKLAGHRLWRFTPFNFEKYPGMRMNVPPDKTAWTVRYPDYFAYDSSEETVLYPEDTAHDGENFQHGVTFGSSAMLRSIPFNTFDSKNHIRRQSLLGRYRLDPNTGAPLNPMGRSGLLGKGLLPRWGPNHSIVVVVTRWSINPKTGTAVMRGNRGVLQVVALERNKRFCVPWFFTDHTNRCDFDECVPTLIRAFFEARARACCSERRADRLLRRIDKAEVTQIFKGYLDDQLNADGGWLETVVINYHEGEGRGAQLTDDILKVFSEAVSDEQVKWIEVAHNSNLRTSHNYILKSVAEIKGAFY